MDLQYPGSQCGCTGSRPVISTRKSIAGIMYIPGQGTEKDFPSCKEAYWCMNAERLAVLPEKRA